MMTEYVHVMEVLLHFILKYNDFLPIFVFSLLYFAKHYEYW